MASTERKLLCCVGILLALVLFFASDLSAKIVECQPYPTTLNEILQLKSEKAAALVARCTKNYTLEAAMTQLRSGMSDVEGALPSGSTHADVAADVADELANITARLVELSESLRGRGTPNRNSKDALQPEAESPCPGQETKRAAGWGGEDPLPKKGRGCIVQMHSAVDLQVPEGMNTSEDWARSLKYYMTCPLINRMYAERHGYRFIFSNGSEVEDPQRSTSWWKVRLMRNVLATTCDWALWLDSDVYLRMEEHTLSMEGLIERLASNWSGPFEDGTNQSFMGSDPRGLLDPEVKDGAIGLFPRNGDSRGGFNSREWLNPGKDYVCAGIQLWKNSSLTLQIMDDWYYNVTKDLYVVRTLEQRRLNKHIIPLYLKHMVIVPFGMLNAQELRSGQTKLQMARHIWTDVYNKHGPEYRDGEMRNALLAFYTLRDVEAHNTNL